MATYCALHVRTTNVEGVVDALRHHIDRRCLTRTSVAAGLNAVDAARLCTGYGVSGVSWFALCTTHDGWVVAEHDELSHLTILASRLSARFDTRVIAVLRQTASGSFGIEVHDHGALRRALEFEDGVLRASGAPFDFESEIESLAQGSGVLFDEEIQAICSRLDLSLNELLRPASLRSEWIVVRAKRG